MKRRAFSLLLSLTLLLSLALPATTAYAEDGSSNKGMEISKTATANQDGSYTITLEAYATGEKEISEVTEDVPTDIVLVLDQSGSMAETMSTYGFRKYTSRSNSYLYNRRHNGGNNNLYYQLDDGSYATVSVVKQETLSYKPLPDNLVNYETDWTDWFNLTTDCYFYYAENLYEKVGEEYKKVSLTRDWIRTGIFLFQGYYQYTYTFSNGDSIRSDSDEESPNLGSHKPLYTGVVDATYTYTYTDKDGVTQTIGTSTGADTQPTEFTLYERYQSGSTRLEALKDAVTNFADAVAKKAAGADKTLGTDDDVNHRIAVVGFSSDDYSNTELLTGVQITTGNHNYGTDPVDTYTSTYYYPTGYAKNGVQYGSITDEQYGNALQDMNTAAGKANVTDAFNALTAHGGTRTNDGMAMANEIFENTPIDAGKKRNRVVIVFTDGVPGLTGYDSDIAASAISEGNTAKKTYGATVYTVGIFSGADATSAGDENGTDTQKANWFMQKLSSNDGKVQTPSYYLSAADAGTLNSIFQQISDQIETGGSETTLDEKAVIKDIIAPAFTLPQGATASDITLETCKCTGKNGDAYIWENNNDAMGATAVIGSTDTDDATTTNNQVSVTGFDFAENWVGTETSAEGTTTYRGNKLVIKFNVTPRPGFFGGNGVDTNTSAGVYENKDATDPVLTFPKPDVNVPLAEPTVNVPDANVYLGAYYSQTVPEDAVKMGATVTIAGYPIDFSKADDPDHPYGLEPWQVKYVNISISAATTGNGGSFENIQEDISYAVTVTVSPKTPGTSGEQTDTGTGTIHVFKPELTFKDSDVWYGGAAPTDFSGNLQEKTWVNGTKKHDDQDVQMLNNEPTLNLTYAPEDGKIADGKVNTKQDIAVDVTVKIGETDVTGHTTFVHTKCADDNTCTDPANGKFWLHVKTCTLNITKQGGADNESYVFDVLKDGEKYSEVTVWGNGTETLVELPIGTYTISENTGWSWRYNADNGSGAALSAANPNGSITCTNSSNGKIYWLNGFSQVVRNIFGISH